MWKPAIILYGSLIEAILRENTKAKDFSSSLEKARNKEIISDIEFHQIHVVRNSRNYVHLHKELSEDINIINDYWAKALADLCESLIKRLKNNKSYKDE